MSPRPFLAVVSVRFRALLQYRTAALAGMATQVFFGWVRLMVFDAFYRSAPGAAMPLSPVELTGYIWLGQAFFLLTIAFLDAEVAQSIQSGTVAFELLRPVDLYGLWFGRALSGRLAPMLLRSVPILVLAALFFGMPLPAGPGAALLFLASWAMAVLLVSALTVLVSISMFWTLSGEGASRLVPPLVFLLSGMVVPLPLLPNGVQRVLEFLPFRGIIDVPVRLWLGHLTGPEAYAGLLQQALWIAILVGLGRLLLARGLRRLVVQGG